ncbi:MAG: hypothetical protein IPO33_19610 [Saprospiraceae bacterium]|nr:hypothetical protein [Candidatus Brachybacter algidus]
MVIANKHNISLSKLMEFNDMAEEGLLTKDQLIYLEKKAKSGEQGILYHAAGRNFV